MKILALVYSHPDFFPPTQNALEVLAKHHDVKVLSRNVVKDFPKKHNGIEYFTVGKYRSIREVEATTLFNKISIFSRYCFRSYALIRKSRSDAVIAYDNIPLLAYWLVSKTMRKKITLWYHNHDSIDLTKLRKYSIQWFSGYLESRMFKKVSIFSLPAEDRIKFFNLENFKGDLFTIPNYPSLKRYEQVSPCDSPVNGDVIKIVYQGEIGFGHGFEELIPVLNENIGSKSLEFHAVGFIKPDYLKKLNELAEKHNVLDKITIHDRLPYNELPNFTNRHHIGWAAYLPLNDSFASGAQASNKIYEYMALGLPVVLYNDVHFENYLKEYKWANFSKPSGESILTTIQGIIQNFEIQSKAAINDFTSNLNFETHFEKANRRLEEIVNTENKTS